MHIDYNMPLVNFSSVTLENANFIRTYFSQLINPLSSVTYSPYRLIVVWQVAHVTYTMILYSNDII